MADLYVEMSAHQTTISQKVTRRNVVESAFGEEKCVMMEGTNARQEGGLNAETPAYKMFTMKIMGTGSAPASASLDQTNVAMMVQSYNKPLLIAKQPSLL